MSIVEPGRLRGLTNAEKKQITVLRQLIDIIGVQIATKSGALDSVFTNLRLKVKDLNIILKPSTNNVVSSRPSNSIVDDSGVTDSRISENMAQYLTDIAEPYQAVDNGDESCVSIPKDEASSLETTDSIFAITEKDVEKLIYLINDAEKQCRADNEGLIFEEDFLHPIAHACLTMWNTVEGFRTPPMITLSDEEKAQRKKRHDETVAKKKEAAENLRKLQQAKEEEEMKKAALKRSLKHNQADHSIEDSLVANAKPLGFVDYMFLPSEGAGIFFGKAIEVWSVIVSLPKAFQLSKYTLSMFMSAMASETQQYLVEETCKALISVGIKGSPLVKETPVNTRGMGWFEQVKEFIMVTSGRKQQRKQEAMRLAAAKKKALKSRVKKSEENITTAGVKRTRDGNSGEESEEHSGSSSDENYESNEEDEESSDNDEQEEDGNQEEIKELLEDFETYKSRSTWTNMNLKNRLIIMKYLVDAIVNAPVVVAAGDSALSDYLAEEIAYSKELKELKDAADKKLKELIKQHGMNNKAVEGNKTNSENQMEESATDEKSDNKRNLTPEQQKAAIEEKLKSDIEAAKLKRIRKMEDKCENSIIFPVGEDRYRRLYWRFPMDSNVYVETVRATSTFPILKKAKPVINVGDDDEIPISSGPEGTSEATTTTDADDCSVGQRLWGKITAADLPVFLSSLETRGIREVALKKELELLVNHLYTLVPLDTHRITRSRALTGGYTNEFYV